MKEKIDWYQEVLELEPGSKVFFPLARLLSECGQTDRAVQTLRHGLDRHPEYIEARLYLIDLLFRTGQTDMCEQQMQQLAPLFSRYTGFWQAWGSVLAASGKERDTGLALSFLAAAFRQGSLTLADVLARGLRATLDDVDAMPAARPAAQAVSAPRRPAAPVAEPTTKPAPAAPCTASAPRLEAVQESEEATSPLTSLVQSLPVESPSCASGDDDADEAEERFSLRTRSMAEVLAEQGDYTGALEIYQELAAQAVTPEESADLQYRISTLTTHLGNAQEYIPPSEPQADATSGKHRVLSVLEALAERLETRVHG